MGFPPALLPSVAPLQSTTPIILLLLRPSSHFTTTAAVAGLSQRRQFFPSKFSLPVPNKLFPSISLKPPFSSPFHFPLLSNHSTHNTEFTNNNNNNDNINGGGGGNNPFNFNNWWHWSDDGDSSSNPYLLFIVSIALFILFVSSAKGIISNKKNDDDAVWEVKGGQRNKLIPDYVRDVFIVPPETWSWWSTTSSSSSSSLSYGDIIPKLWSQCRDLFMRLMLPEGFPNSVTIDYSEYSLWRGVQGVAAQISGVLATQALLYAVGLGKGAIPTAAAVNWVLKDGIGYLSKILLSKFGRHFDVNPKGWRLCADLLENAAYGLEILTPAFPHLFVPIGAAAGAGRSAAALIQAATRSCFYAGFAAQRNFAEVIAKGEAQGMVSKSIGILLGIAIANCIQSSTPLALITFGAVTWIHMFCNVKSYQSIQLRTLNPYRASLVFGEYLLSGLIPSVKEVNDEEPFFPAMPHLNLKPESKAEPAILSAEAKDAAACIEQRLQLGSKLSDVIETKMDALALFDLYRDEGYLLTEHDGRFLVILKESCSPQDMLKSLFHVSYLYWLENNVGLKSVSAYEDCRPGGRLHISLEYVQREFSHVKIDSELAGWTTDGLIARPLPYRIRTGYLTPAAKC